MEGIRFIGFVDGVVNDPHGQGRGCLREIEFPARRVQGEVGTDGCRAIENYSRGPAGWGRIANQGRRRCRSGKVFKNSGGRRKRDGRHRFVRNNNHATHVLT